MNLPLRTATSPVFVVHGAEEPREDDAMIERLTDLPAGIDGLRAKGTVTREDYERVVVPHGRLRAEDFDALALTVDPWIEAHGELRGLVVHAREFPGWESLGSFFGHVRFVRDHHRKIRRVALCAGGALAALAPTLARHFVTAEVRHFDYDNLERAIAWAGGATAS